MRRAQVLLLVLVLAAGAVAAGGCGDTSRAKEYMEKGDELSLKLSGYTDDAGFDALAFLSKLGVEFADTGGISSDTVIDEARSQIESLNAEGDKAIAEYEKILGLSGVDDYKQYAEYRIAAVEAEMEVLAAVDDLLDRLAGAPEGTSLKDSVTGWAKANTGAAVAAVKAFTNSLDAANLKKDKGL
ncbi:MAG: hypothetical protein FJ313_06040 [Gemmatimonadetes bacterium]|nr:hypothetical protein [Gemmatimonadota bacterium]